MEWLNIDEMQPEDMNSVLLYTPFDFFGEAHSCVGNREGIRDCNTKIGNRIVPIFTHWMPLPSKPHFKDLNKGKI